MDIYILYHVLSPYCILELFCMSRSVLKVKVTGVVTLRLAEVGADVTPNTATDDSVMPA